MSDLIGNQQVGLQLIIKDSELTAEP